jgi:hypothetical protein
MAIRVTGAARILGMPAIADTRPARADELIRFCSCGLGQKQSYAERDAN